ncbi:LPXTG cell wall anchor domain-containing protein [Pseudolactococcus reticulitermitis]|uniref:LPXTG cell wall anchor domain-containing protein n=1 Tax=Pseudolactococcus reticulitermitis TaxID=2025039 RepID=UPI0012FF6C00|nr:LPXTG cell wall anchor domain-containing protein [Lactococcus reticulitermitis]
MKKIVKCLLLTLILVVSTGSLHISAETYGEFQVEKGAPSQTPLPSGGSGVDAANKLPVTGEQIATWAIFGGLLLLAFVLLLLALRKIKERVADDVFEK